MKIPDDYKLTTEFLAMNQKAMDRLRRTHPGLNDRDIAYALQHAQMLTDHPTLGRTISVASMLLGKSAIGNSQVREGDSTAEEGLEGGAAT